MAWAERKVSPSGKVKWMGRYRDPSGRTRSARYHSTERAALAAARDQEAAIRGGRWIDPAAGTITFSDYFEKRWFPNRPGEINTRKMHLSNYRADNQGLRKRWGSHPVNKITRFEVQEWVNDMVAEGTLSAETIVKRYSTLQLVLAASRGVSALDDRLIPENPCARVILPKIVPPAVDVYTPEEMDALMAELPDWWVPQQQFQNAMGIRWGELMGATVGSLTTGFQKLVVRRTVIEPGRTWTGTDSPFMWKDYPKTATVRRLIIPPIERDLLSELIDVRCLAPSDRLFSMHDGKGNVARTDVWPEGLPVTKSHYRESVWKPAVRRAGLRYLKPHSARGSHISELLNAGVDAPTVMARAGHTRWATTRRYQDLADAADNRVLEALARRHRNAPRKAEDEA